MGKRIFDFWTALVLLIFLSPLFLLIYVLVGLMVGRPALFRQQRPGMGGKPFEMLKFRTMTDAKGVDDQLLPDRERMTAFGRVLRSTSLDELPELWNVLKGDMSIVGPRPLLMEYLPLYSEEQSRRHDVRPGITGWAQVNGRNLLSWNKKFEMDVWYVEHRSIWLDLKILVMTVRKVFAREGITEGGEVTVSKFEGNEK